MKKILLFISLAMASFAAAKDDATVVRVDRLPVAVRNKHYVSNQTPLMPQQFVKLPVGSISPGRVVVETAGASEGWIEWAFGRN